MKKTISWTLLLVLILAVGIPLVWGQQTSAVQSAQQEETDSIFFGSPFSLDNPVSYPQTTNAVIWIREGVKRRFTLATHSGSFSREESLASSQMYVDLFYTRWNSPPPLREGTYHSYSITVDRPMLLQIRGSRAPIKGYLVDSSGEIIVNSNHSINEYDSFETMIMEAHVEPGTYTLRVFWYHHGFWGYYNSGQYSVSLYELADTTARVDVQLPIINGRIEPPSKDLVLDYATEDHTAIAGEDYTSTSGTITFPAGTTNWTQVIYVPILDDDVSESKEYFRFVVTNRSTGKAIAATIGILQYSRERLDDPSELSFHFAHSPVLSVLEGDEGPTNAALNIQLLVNGVPTKDVSVDYVTQDGTATAGEDYTATSGTITFPAYTTYLTRTIDIPILGDTDVEPDEYFNILLSNPTNVLIPPRNARIEIVNDDHIGGVTPIITPFPLAARRLDSVLAHVQHQASVLE